MTVDSRVLPQPPSCNACQLSHNQGLASSAFARHYSRNHYCFLFLWVLRCFTSPRSLQLPYTFRQRSPDITPEIQGFPIRRSTDQSSFTSSPWLIAGYNVLHRLLMPRHPPIALSSLSPNQNDQQQNKLQKMLASTIQFSNNKQTPTNTHPHRSAHRLASSCCDPTTIVAEAPEPNNVPPPHPRQMPEPVPHPTGAVLDTRTPTRIRLGQCLPQFSHPTTHTTLGCERSHPGPVKTVGRRAP